MTDGGLRHVVASTISALAFLTAASILAVFAGSSRSLGFVDLLLVVAFAVLTRLEYPIGAGSAVPAQLAFVPMLFVLPLRFVPLAVAAGSLLATTVAAGRGKKPTLCPNALGASWFALPPVVVLLAAGEQPFAWRHWPLYVAAFCAQCLADLVQTVLYERLVNAVSVRPLLEVLVTVYSFDALLTPVALLAAAGGPYSFLALLPFTGVLYVLGRERRSRLDAQSKADLLNVLAHEDELTGTANRRSFDRRLVIEQARAGRHGGPLSICIFDLDNFKLYNDTFGHPAGDALLRRAAEGWLTTLRPDALLARIGGDEFGLILPDASLAAADAVAERLSRATPDQITFSAGVATWRRGETIAELIGRADAALYRAKEGGRDRLVLAA